MAIVRRGDKAPVRPLQGRGEVVFLTTWWNWGERGVWRGARGISPNSKCMAINAWACSCVERCRVSPK